MEHLLAVSVIIWVDVFVNSLPFEFVNEFLALRVVNAVVNRDFATILISHHVDDVPAGLCIKRREYSSFICLLFSPFFPFIHLSILLSIHSFDHSFDHSIIH